MKFSRLITGAGFIVAFGVGALALMAIDFSSSSFDRTVALSNSVNYQPRIIRDKFGVPHIYGERDEDVAFGLAYAHAEDDWATVEEVVRFSRGILAASAGKDAAVTDYLIGALAVQQTIAERYRTDLSPKMRAVVEAYAAGANFYCAEEPARCDKQLLPVTGEDVVAGFFSRTPFFYGLDEHLKKLFEQNDRTQARFESARYAFFRVRRHDEIGSNAMAVAPQRSADGHTRLMVNSHQPYEGPIAWYEARLKSNEGWDMIGGLFPGSPVILLGAGPKLGWAHTVNKPDLVDVFQLKVDNKKKPTQYKMDGEWIDINVRKIKFRVRLFGPFSWPVSRDAYSSKHGLILATENGVFLISYAGSDDIGAIEQWFRMNKAQNFEDWRRAMEMTAIPSFNTIYADATGNIGFYYNAKIPVRDPHTDWSDIVQGDRSELLWKGYREFDKVPQIVNPSSGYVVNANNTPFEASAANDNPDPAAFPPHYGIDTRTTNRGLRIQTLYGGDTSITEEEFLSYKMDHTYAKGSRVMELVSMLAASPELVGHPARDILAKWDGAVSAGNRGAALAVLTAQRARGYLLDDENAEDPDAIAALKHVAAALEAGFGRIDPTWGEVVRLKRGELELPIDGGPDTLRAVYPAGDPAEGSLKSVGGDTYILYADWRGDGTPPKIKTIHQYGAATLDKGSLHYSDQAPLFVEKRYRTPPMELEDLLAEATRDYQPGHSSTSSSPSR